MNQRVAPPQNVACNDHSRAKRQAQAGRRAGREAGSPGAAVRVLGATRAGVRRKEALATAGSRVASSSKSTQDHQVAKSAPCVHLEHGPTKTSYVAGPDSPPRAHQPVDTRPERTLPGSCSFSMEAPDAREQGRNFRLLSDEELPLLLDFLSKYLPESLKFHQTLLTYMRNRVWKFHFYVANDWPEVPVCLHFPGMTLSPNDMLYESVAVFCPDEGLEHLRLLREEDVLINWQNPLYINFVHNNIAEELVTLYNGAGHVEQVLGDVWACDEPEKTEQILDEPTNADAIVEVLPLRAEHAENIHELYPANDMECHELFLRLINNLSAAGVFEDGKLAAWMIQSYYGAMFSMQTKPEYRRKGYGTKLARYLTKRVAESGYKPFVVIRPENEASQSLYKKLGFRKIYQLVRMIFVPESCQDAKDTTLRNNLENAVRDLKLHQTVIHKILTGNGVVEESAEDKSVDDRPALNADVPKTDFDECVTARCSETGNKEENGKVPLVPKVKEPIGTSEGHSGKRIESFVEDEIVVTGDGQNGAGDD